MYRTNLSSAVVRQRVCNRSTIFYYGGALSFLHFQFLTSATDTPLIQRCISRCLTCERVFNRLHFRSDIRISARELCAQCTKVAMSQNMALRLVGESRGLSRASIRSFSKRSFANEKCYCSGGQALMFHSNFAYRNSLLQ